MAELIVALDFNKQSHALSLARQLQKEVKWVKVGLELYTRYGPQVVTELKTLGFKIFLDLKFLDIPNTVQGAVRSATALGIDMLTVHLLGGRAMIKAALKGREQGLDSSQNFTTSQLPLILGVTILTSLGKDDLVWPETREISRVVMDLALQGQSWGIDGVVCSGHELTFLKSKLKPDFYYVTPGIRMEQKNDDQKRTMSPLDAVKSGANFLVVGRPITRAKEPREAARMFQRQIHYH